MEQKRTGLSYVFTLAKEERGKLSLGMLLAVFSSALSFVPYLVVYQILLLIIKQEVTLPAMLGWAGIGIAAAVLQAILTSFAGICSHTAAFNTMHRIKVRVLEHMSKFNLGFFQEHAPGQIKTTLFDDVDRIETFLAHSTLELAQAIVVPLMMFIFMLRLNWIMALIMLVPMILGIAIPMALMGRYPDLTDEFAGDTEKLNASANEFITAMPVIKMYHLIATVPPFQRKGYAKALIEFLVEKYRRQFSILQVGTGDSPLTIPFYEKCGFVRSHTVPNFFTDHYDHPIYECGVHLVDMVYLQRPL